MEKFVFKIPVKTNLRETVLEWAKKQQLFANGNFDNPIDLDNVKVRTGAIQTKTVPESLYINDPIVQEISKIATILTKDVKVFVTNPFEMHKFHQDNYGPQKNLVVKTAALNLLLEDARSSLMFFDQNHEKDVLHPFYEHTYEKDYFYLLNVQQQHGWFNFEKTRYLLTIRIGEPDYQTILNRLKTVYNSIDN